ncbi:MAG: aquaporin [Candidatus Saccharimonas aalborgensis]
MATKKAASTKKATVKKPAVAAKTTKTKVTVKPLAKEVTHPAKSVAHPTVRVKRERTSLALPGNVVNIVFAELIGTFVLTLVALLAAQTVDVLYVGLTLVVLVLAIGAISGAHVNPAVTFAQWTMRRLKGVLVPFYWGAQFLGSMLAVIVMNLVAGGTLKLDFSHMGWNVFDWSVFGIELTATAIFVFGLSAVLSRRDLANTSRALGVGLSLMVGLVVGGGLVSTLQTNVQKSLANSSITSPDQIPHTLRVTNATLNPAVALAVTERPDSAFSRAGDTKNDKQYSRLSIEVITATLIGAALGGNLYLLLAGRRNTVL